MRKQAGCSSSTRLTFANDQKASVHLRILLHYWGKQRAYWGKCPSSYIVKKCPDSAFFKDSSVVGQSCQRAHFPCPPPRIVCDRQRYEASAAGTS